MIISPTKWGTFLLLLLHLAAPPSCWSLFPGSEAQTASAPPHYAREEKEKEKKEGKEKKKTKLKEREEEKNHRIEIFFDASFPSSLGAYYVCMYVCMYVLGLRTYSTYRDLEY